jgi:hypothetical protein
MKLSEIANQVIPLAAAIRGYWEAELPKRHPQYPLVDPDADDGPPPPETEQLQNLLASLPEDIIYELRLLMDLGRMPFTIKDLARHYETLKKWYPQPAQLALVMLDNAVLADYLTDGMAELKKRGLDVDQLTFSLPGLCCSTSRSVANLS